MLSRAIATSTSAARPSPSIPPPRPDLPLYSLDGEVVSLRELLSVNDFESDEVVAIRNLPVGQSLNLGGGAAPIFVLTRLPSVSP